MPRLNCAIQRRRVREFTKGYTIDVKQISKTKLLIIRGEKTEKNIKGIILSQKSPFTISELTKKYPISHGGFYEYLAPYCSGNLISEGLVSKCGTRLGSHLFQVVKK